MVFIEISGRYVVRTKQPVKELDERRIEDKCPLYWPEAAVFVNIKHAALVTEHAFISYSM